MADVLNSSTQSVLRGIHSPILGPIANPIQQPEGGFGSAPGALIFQDLFNDTNGTTLNNHTPDLDPSGLGWTRDLQTMVIQDNKCEEDINSAVSISTADALQADVVITATGCTHHRNSADRANMGVVFRFVDTNNFWAFLLNSSTPDPWNWIIQKTVAGSASYPLAAVDGITGGSVATITPEMIVTLSGDNIRCQVVSEGVDMNLTDAAHNTATRFGLRANNVSSPTPKSQCESIAVNDNS
jgi:hypothetical protein